MKILRACLLLYLPLIAFAVLPVADGVVKDTLYPIRFYLTCALALGGGLALFALSSSGQSVFQAFRSWLHRSGASRRDRLGLSCIVMYLVWVLVSSAASPMSGYAWLGSPYTLFGSIMLIACFGIMLVYAHSRPLRLLPPVMALITLVMAGLALAEAVGFKPLGSLITSANISYPAATIGHRPHLGGWFALVSLMP
ncbi:hypothetical protein, partial [uncultured Deinococcus sp.]|uniref:hypothetical protein n=1 Tax=uncultured Deinococcus sp. TaxID=158789 RepID=UPI003749C7D5